MDGRYLSLTRSIEAAWESLTRGRLTVVFGHGGEVSAVGERELPEVARQALLGGAALDGHQADGLRWWVAGPGTVQLVGWSPEAGDWGPVLRSWADLLSAAVEEAQVSDGLAGELGSAWDRLAFLYELAQIAARATSLPQMLSSVVRLLREILLVEETFVFVESAEAGWSQLTASGAPIGRAEPMLQAVLEAGRPLRLADVQLAAQTSSAVFAQASDLLIAPLFSPGAIRGAIGAVDPARGKFNVSDMQLLASVAEQVGAWVDAERKRSATVEARRMDHELAIAAQIQGNLQPMELPAIAGMEVAAHLQAASRVGGDLLDVARDSQGRTLVMLADVAGKGVPAAILSALVHAVFQSLAEHTSDPGALLRDLNQLVHTDLERAQAFVTAVVVRFDPDGNGCEYASAGQVEPALWRAAEGRVEFLEATGLPIGIEVEPGYAMRRVEFRPGDVLLLYSDGLTEAQDANGKVLGRAGLTDMMIASHPATAGQQIRLIMQGLEVFRQEQALEDDVVLFLARRQPTVEESAATVPFVIPASLSAVGRVVDMIRRAGEENGAQALSHDLALAASEVVTNQIQHAYGGGPGRVLGRLAAAADRMQVDLYDCGEPFAPSAEPPPPDPRDPPERGYGLRLAKGLVDVCSYERLEGGRNHWKLVKSTNGGRTHED